jgi:hypothetical protein
MNTGSSAPSDTLCHSGGRTYKQEVAGSNPALPTIYPFFSD